MSRGYSKPSRTLHWGTALLVVALAGLGLVMVELPSDTPSDVAWKIDLYSLHKTLGVLALVLGLLRIVSTARAYRPPPLANHRAVEIAASRAVQAYFLLALIMLPTTGLTKHLASGGPAPVWLWPIDGWIALDESKVLADAAGAIHYALAYGLIVAFVLHVGGALKHHIVDRDDTLRRMMSGTSREAPVEQNERSRTVRLGVAAGVVISAVVVFLGLSMPWTNDIGDAQPDSTAESGDGASTLEEVDGLPNWVVDYANSTLEIEAVQSGKPFVARFGRFAAEILLDPSAPETGRIRVEIDLTSFDSGIAERDSAAISPGWLAANEFPKARFASSRITSTSDGRYRAEGTLSLKGLEQPITLDFTLAQDGATATADGHTAVNRSEYKVGVGQWATSETVGFDVKIRFHILANR